MEGKPLTENDKLVAEALAKSGGMKFDTGKAPLSLLSRVWLEGTAQVLGFGARKYHAHNWRNGIQISRLLDSLQRHVLAFQDGEDYDNCKPDCPPDCKMHSGLPHLDHASCCLMFLRELWERQPEMDDRYKPANKKPAHEPERRGKPA